MAFADSIDVAYLHKHEMEVVLKTYIPLSMVTDSHSILDLLTKTTCTTENRFIIDLQTLKDTCKSFHVSFDPS